MKRIDTVFFFFFFSYSAEELGKGLKGRRGEINIGKAARLGPDNIKSLNHSQWPKQPLQIFSRHALPQSSHEYPPHLTRFFCFLIFHCLMRPTPKDWGWRWRNKELGKPKGSFPLFDSREFAGKHNARKWKNSLFFFFLGFFLINQTENKWKERKKSRVRNKSENLRKRGRSYCISWE